tara:strand:+ start:225420 stop:226727 length:1308 start_codon:yes stop_codon:yes gene_type:complete
MLKKLKLNKDNNEIIRKGFSFFVIRSIGLLASYFFAFIIARQFGASIYGIVAICFSILLFASVFSRLGLDINLVRYYSDGKKWDESGLFLRVIIKSFIFSIFIVLFLFLFKHLLVYKLFQKPILSVYFNWILFTIPLWTIVVVSGSLFQAKRNNNLFAFLNNPGRFLFSILFLFIFYLISKDPIIIVQAHFFGVLLLAIISLIYSFKCFSEITLKSKFNSFVFLRESIPMMVSGASLILLGGLDTFILGIYDSEENIGVYNISLKLATVTLISLQAINSILMPKVAESFKTGDTKRFNKVISFSTNLNFLITIIVVIFILIFRIQILSLFGEEFLKGESILILLCIAQIINSFSGSVGVILQMTGNQIVFQNIILIALLINICLNFLLIPIYGSYGAALTTLISIAFWNFSGAYYLNRKHNIISYFNCKNLNNGN